MSRRGRDDEPFLFDLPLTPEEDEEVGHGEPRPAEERQQPSARAPRAEDDESPLAPEAFFDELFEQPTDRPPPHRPSPRPRGAVGDPLDWDVVEREAEPEDPSPVEVSSTTPRRPGLLPRLLAAGVDALLLATVAGIGLVGVTLLDAHPGLAILPGLAVLLLVFSFAYSVVPLAFWGATPGMVAVGLVARDRDGGPLTFGQTALRWLAGLLTTLLLGLPLLLALEPLGARSLADRLSRSLTWQRPS